LSNGFSQKIENHMAAVRDQLVAYNFTKIHRTLRVPGDGRWRRGASFFDVMHLLNLPIEPESAKAA